MLGVTERTESVCCAVVSLSCALQAAERILAAEEAEASRLAAAGAEGGETQQSGAGEIVKILLLQCQQHQQEWQAHFCAVP